MSQSLDHMVLWVTHRFRIFFSNFLLIISLFFKNTLKNTKQKRDTQIYAKKKNLCSDRHQFTQVVTLLYPEV